MPNDITDFFPLAAESTESILARMLADINAGIDPTDPLYADVLPGSIWDDLSRADALEMDRLYDRMLSEVPAAALPAWATGTWLDQWAQALGLARKAASFAGGIVTFTGADGTDITAGTQVSTEAPTPDSDPETFEVTTSGTISGGVYDAPVQALDAGSQGNVAANAVTILGTPVPDTTVSNAAAITGGSDVETDEALQDRVMKKLRGTNGAGNIDYYENLALNYPGVGFVTVLANTPALGHVTISLRDVNGDPVPSSIIDGFQAQVDPPPVGQGYGQATIGATIVVTTPTATTVIVAASITPETAYSIGGVGGTHDLTDDITTAVQDYFDTLGVGDEVVLNKVLGAIVDVNGVEDVSGVTLDGTAANLVIASDHVAELQLPLTLS